jgi:hypothetical protein
MTYSVSEEKIERMGADELREELRRALRAERDATAMQRAEETKKDKAIEYVGSARINIQSALAVKHLLRYGEHALGANAHPNVHNFLTDAVKDLDLAYEAADVMPF